MEQVREAVDAIDPAGDNYQLVRALETAIAVCYSRPFTESKFCKLGEADAPPPDGGWRDLHDQILRMRKAVYAHTDKAGARDAPIEIVALPDGTSGYAFTEQWLPLDRSFLPAIRALAESQRDSFRQEAMRLEAQVQKAGS